MKVFIRDLVFAFPVIVLTPQRERVDPERITQRGPQLNPPRPPKTQVSTREMEPSSHIRKPPYCAWRQSLNPGTEKNKSADSISPSAGSQSWYFPWDKEEQRGPSPMPSVHGLPANPAHLLYHCLPHYRGHYVFSAFVLGQVP